MLLRVGCNCTMYMWHGQSRIYSRDAGRKSARHNREADNKTHFSLYLEGPDIVTNKKLILYYGRSFLSFLLPSLPTE